jgi:hypothetical protein
MLYQSQPAQSRRLPRGGLSVPLQPPPGQHLSPLPAIAPSPSMARVPADEGADMSDAHTDLLVTI